MSQFLDFARRGRNDWWRYILAPVAGVTLWFVLIVAGTLGATLTHLLPADFADLAKDPSHPALFYSFTGLVFAGFAIAVALAAWAIQGKRPGDIIGAWRWRDVAIGAGLWLILCGAGALVDWALHPGAFHLTLGPATATLALFAIPSLGAQTFCEEFLFRGYVTQGLLLATRRPRLTATVVCIVIPFLVFPLLLLANVVLNGAAALSGPALVGTLAPMGVALAIFVVCLIPAVARRPQLLAALLSGLIFASLHIPNGWPQAAGALVFGVVVALIAMRTGGLGFGWGMHVANNLFGAILVVSTDDVLRGSPGVFTAAAPELAWVDVAFSVVAFALVWVLVARFLPAVPEPAEEVFA